MTPPRSRILAIVLMAAGAMAITEGLAEACSCGRAGPGPLPKHKPGSSAVFIAKAESVISRFESVGANQRGLVTVTTLSVRTVFDGPTIDRLELENRGSSCDVIFKEGETYLVFAGLRNNGTMDVNKCSATRPLSEAAMHLKYFEGLRDGRPQALVVGMVLRRGLDRNGAPALLMLKEPVDVIASGEGGTYSTRTDRGDDFFLVVPPGEFEIRIEHKGKSLLAPTKRLTLANGDGISEQLIIDTPQ